MSKATAIIVVAAVALVSFAAGHMHSSAAFSRAYRSCTETVAAEYTAKIREEFDKGEREWKAKHSPPPWPLRLPLPKSSRESFQNKYL